MAEHPLLTLTLDLDACTSRELAALYDAFLDLTNRRWLSDAPVDAFYAAYKAVGEAILTRDVVSLDDADAQIAVIHDADGTTWAEQLPGLAERARARLRLSSPHQPKAEVRRG
ncbi:hypothetical protein [Rubellimicrobium aerolatum]|uniref:Barstar (barnase inhibitor) domain-containing protein n=1 Tax=Rubellimicrobium aerolatum TaxID=490979 RepID=A0ABW0SFB3_9RHOB|nr:hypothetical protein [Rubellimicrobium aerolatum]MBP1806475.1 hypothetical protein [Rubellimicrobium aerolatum]